MEKENCVMCWEETEYDKDTPINKRSYYVEGAGQLCEECYEKIYGHSTQERYRKNE